MGLVVRQTLKASFANYVGVLVGVVNMLILMPLIFSESEIGIIKMLTENMVMLAGFATLGISSSMYRYYPHFKDDPNGKLHGFDFWAAFIPFVGFMVITLLMIVGKSWVVSYFSEKAAAFLEYYLLLIPLAFTQIFFSVFEVTAAIENRIVIPKFLKEILMRVLTAVAFLLYYFGWLNFYQSVLLLVIFYFVPLLLIFIYSAKLRKIHLRPDFHYLKNNTHIVRDFLNYTGIITLGSLSGFILAKIDMIMISAKMGLDYTGVYMIAVYVATIIEIPRRSLVQILSTKISQQMVDENHSETEKLYKQTSTLLFISALFLLLCILINIDSMYKIMPNGDLYIGGTAVIYILAISKCIELITSMGQVIIMYSRYYYITLLMTIVTAVIGILLNLLLISVYGLTGAAIATAITIIIQQIIIGITIYTKLGFHSFTITQLKTAFLFIIAIGVNFIIPTLTNAWLDISVRTVVIAGIFILVLYKAQWSTETNQIINNLIRRVKDRNFKPY